MNTRSDTSAVGSHLKSSGERMAARCRWPSGLNIRVLLQSRPHDNERSWCTWLARREHSMPNSQPCDWGPGPPAPPCYAIRFPDISYVQRLLQRATFFPLTTFHVRLYILEGALLGHCWRCYIGLRLSSWCNYLRARQGLLQCPPTCWRNLTAFTKLLRRTVIPKVRPRIHSRGTILSMYLGSIPHRKLCLPRLRRRRERTLPQPTPMTTGGTSRALTTQSNSTPRSRP